MDLVLQELQMKGSCRGSEDPRFWNFEDDSIKTVPTEIQIICRLCPVEGKCLDWALENEVDEGEVGIWGGTTPFQRQQLKRTLNRVRCPGCKSEGVVPTQRGEMCISCGISWLA